ncbi:hypothetical protein MRB53_012467 [Persea americana]|uniref:Uncharacterized protein n=1 Tax=Persea americana TaxID=3435 RepID=A0ACC2LXW1_PERAE|nr:hypothetical protein MRB53_012467 [Persea americana]
MIKGFSDISRRILASVVSATSMDNGIVDVVSSSLCARLTACSLCLASLSSSLTESVCSMNLSNHVSVGPAITRRPVSWILEETESAGNKSIITGYQGTDIYFLRLALNASRGPSKLSIWLNTLVPRWMGSDRLRK